jgi:ferredoxin
MRVTVDSEVCQGHLRCYSTAPDLFGADDLGYAVPAEAEFNDDETIARARAAAGFCPERAIRLIP